MTDTATHIGNLNVNVPAGQDDPVDGDNEIRQIKICLVNDLGGITGPVTATHTELNQLAGLTEGDVTASKAVVVDASKDIGTFNVVTANSFVGDVTGNVDGDVTGDVTGDLTGNVTATSVLADGVTATSQAGTNDSTLVATTAFVQDAVALGFAAVPAYLVAGSSIQTTDLNNDVATPVSHGLGAVPSFIIINLVNKTSDAGYSADDIVPLSCIVQPSATDVITASANATTITLTTDVGSTIYIGHKTTGNATALTATKWKAVATPYLVGT
jgi:hypothetical protein